MRLNFAPAKQGWAVDNAVAILPGRTQVEAQGMLRLTGAPSFNRQNATCVQPPSGLADGCPARSIPPIRQLECGGGVFGKPSSDAGDPARFEQLELAIGPATLKGRVNGSHRRNARQTSRLRPCRNEIDIDALRALAIAADGR